MNDNFSVSPQSIQGLGQRLIKGDCSVEKNLALVRHSGRWTLIDTSKEAGALQGTVIQGAALTTLMKAVANGEKQEPAAGLTEKEFKDLTKNVKFRNLCRLIPGIEKEAHVDKRTRTSDIMNKVYDSAKIIGKGLGEIEKKQLQGQLVGVSGRYVGEDQPEHSYWISEVVFRDTQKSSNEVNLLVTCWKNDKETNLSLKEWYSFKKVEWEQSNIEQEFLPWLAMESWLTQQKEAYHKADPIKPFNEQEFKDWQEAQRDPILVLPTWQLKEMSGKNNDADFQIWRTDIIKERKEEHEKFVNKTGLSDITYEDFERMYSEFVSSGSIDEFERWVLKQDWEKAKNSGNNDDLITYIKKIQWTQETKTGKTSEPFDIWNVEQEKALHNRHQNTHIPLSFETWKAQQDDSLLVDQAPFVLLNENSRKIYRTICENGHLKRNDYPLNTEYEKTLHSGKGYAIFVIGPNEDLYSGSHIGGVFHHSSFLAEGAIIAAGEIKTNPDGSIAELSSKSGHYRPTNIQNIYMLKYFQSRGVDLTNIKFTFYGAKGTEERNALNYLNELEHLQALNNIDPQALQ